jgi:hypothetical protein
MPRNFLQSSSITTEAVYPLPTQYSNEQIKIGFAQFDEDLRRIRVPAFGPGRYCRLLGNFGMIGMQPFCAKIVHFLRGRSVTVNVVN